MIDTLSSIWMAGYPVHLLAEIPGTRQPNESRLNDTLQTIRSVRHCWDFLPSQSALRLRELVGASRRVRRGPSLGELTSAGANNSRVALHAAKRPTTTAYCYRASREWAVNPDFAFAPSDSSMTTNQKIRKDALVVFQWSLKRAGVRCPKWARTPEMQKQFLRIYQKAQWKRVFRHNNYHVDHIYPLHGQTVSGLHVPWNLHVIRAEINMAKGTLIVDEWTPKLRSPIPTFVEWFADSLEND